MKYKVTIKLDNGNEVHAVADGVDQTQALDKLMGNDKFIEFVGDAELMDLQIEPCDEDSSTPDYVLTQSKERKNWYVLGSEQEGMVIMWEKGKFNNTNEVYPLKDEAPDALQLASSQRRMADWLAVNYPELV